MNLIFLKNLITFVFNFASNCLVRYALTDKLTLQKLGLADYDHQIDLSPTLFENILPGLSKSLAKIRVTPLCVKYRAYWLKQLVPACLIHNGDKHFMK